MTTDQLKEIQGLVGKNQLQKAIEWLVQLSDGGDYANEASALARRHTANERDNRMGVLSNDEYGRNSSKVSIGILNLATELKREASNPASESSSVNSEQKNNIGNQFNGNTFNGPVTINNSGNE